MNKLARLPNVRSQRGVTLIELMVVIAFVAVAILALSSVQTQSYRDVDNTGRRTRALELASSQMEVVRAAGYTLAASNAGTSGNFAWSTAVTQADVDLKQVTVTVTWTERGLPTSVRLVNLISSR
jgi:prepilin-type N-terminal cleavage/methylation domain-containing protein